MTRDPQDFTLFDRGDPGEPGERLAQTTLPELLRAGAAADAAVEGAPDDPAVLSPAILSPAAPASERPPYTDRTPPDGRVPWGWLDVGLLALLAIGATFAFGIAIVVLLLALGVSSAHLRNSPSYQGMVAVVAQILADALLMVFLAAQARARFHSPFWQTLGWRRLKIGELPRGVTYLGFMVVGFVLATLVTLLDSVFPSKTPLPIQELLADHRTALLFMLTAVLVAPVVEETVFRGYLYPVCVRSFGTGWGILATGTMFGLLHSVQLWGGWWQIGFLVLVGIVLTLARAATGTVVASYLIHVSYNALPVFAYLLGTYGFHQSPVLH